ncbi:MAG: hypothetical protein HGN29_16815 [Asgard group archaeon]|nr:hypothetical protein [Asgard group archaeon]
MFDESIIDEYKILQNKDRRKTIRIYLFVSLPFIVVAIPFLVLYNKGVWAVTMFWSFFGTALLMLLIFGLMLINHAGSKPMYDYLYPKIIDIINSETKNNLHYESGMDKKSKDFSEYELKGGLFIKAAIHTTWFTINFDKQDKQIKVASLKIFNRGNKGQEYIVFEGTYFVFYTTNNSYFQLREKQIGKPWHKHVKMKKIDTQDDIKEYIVEEGTGNNFIDRRYYDLYDFLKQREGRVYISGIPGEIHVALDSKANKFVKAIGIRKISVDKLFEVQQRIMEIIDLSDRIVQIIK